MLSLAKLSIRQPKAALASWLVVIGVLTAIGFGIGQSISPSVATIKGTPSYRAQKLAEERFGPSQLVPILLEGPKATLDTVGPKLVKDLVDRPHTRALSAWDAGTASAGLRPNPNAAMIVVAVDRSEKDAVKYDQPQIEKLVKRDVTAPAKAYVSGQPSIDRALKSESVSTLQHSALIAFGVLFVILLLGLRAPLAAVLVTIVAGATTMASFGIATLLGKGMEVDALAMATGAIAGLARGASFSLVMLDRFHRDQTADPRRTVDEVLGDALGTTGRALLFAGTVMVAAMLLTDFLSTTDVLATLGIIAVLCTTLATGAAVVVVPAALALFGPAVNWRLPAPAFLSRIWDRMVGVGDTIARHPLPFGALGAAALLALAVPTVAAKTGPQDVRQLPPNNQARIAFNEIARVMGPGYPTPYSVIVSNPNGPITTTAMIASINKLQAQIAKDPAVRTVQGPGQLNANAQDLQKLGPGLHNSVAVSKQSKKDLLKLINGLGEAGAGTAQLKAGLLQAVSGADQLNTGAGQAVAGAGKIHTGTAQASAGSVQLSNGLNTAFAGSQLLKSGAGQALQGATELLAGIRLSQGPANLSLPAIRSVATLTRQATSALATTRGSATQAQGAIATALGDLSAMTTGKSDPRYKSIVNALASANTAATNTVTGIVNTFNKTAGAQLVSGGMADQAPGLVAGLNMLSSGASDLQSGVQKLRDGTGDLNGGMGQLANGGQQLRSGLGQLTAGTGALETGLGQLASGTGQLAYGLAAAPNGAGQLQSGLGIMQSGVIKARGQVPSTADLEKLFRQSPGMFSSGYLLLAAAEGALPADRNAATFTVNLLRGGNAGQIIVTPRYAISDPRTKQLGTRLDSTISNWAKTNHLEAAVGGPAGSLFDIANNADKKLPATIIGTVLGVALLLTLMLRSILIPAVATLCAVLTTAAGFGVMQLLFGGSNPPLDGPGTFDPISLTEILAAIFGASLLYLVVLITRTREDFVTRGDARASLVRAMRSTKSATSGIAAVTIGVVVPFMFSELQPVRRIAVAAAVAVAVMAYVIIPVVLPAAMSLLGRIGWWPTHAPGTVLRPPRWNVRLPHLRLPRPAHR